MRLGLGILGSRLGLRIDLGFKVGQPWTTNLRVMWMDKWVMSRCTQIHKKFVPNCFILYLMMPKNSIFSPSAKIKVCTLSKVPPPVWPHHQHTHTQQVKKNLTTSLTHAKQVKKTHIWICTGTTSIPVYRPKHTFDLKNSNFAGAGCQENLMHLHSKLSPVSESSTHPLQNYALQKILG